VGNKGEYMKGIVTFVKEKFRDIYAQIWWFLYDKGCMKEYRALQEEGERLEREWQEICLHAYEAMLEEEDQAQRSQWLEEYYQEPEEARYESEESYREEEDEEDPDETVENFSEHPSLAAEDDAEPLSPEMEYWFTPCDKCGKYPEFCPCDGKFED